MKNRIIFALGVLALAVAPLSALAVFAEGAVWTIPLAIPLFGSGAAITKRLVRTSSKKCGD